MVDQDRVDDLLVAAEAYLAEVDAARVWEIVCDDLGDLDVFLQEVARMRDAT